jgi:hypothetical protein
MAEDRKAAARAELAQALRLDKLSAAERRTFLARFHGGPRAAADPPPPRHREHGDGRARG